MISGRSLLAAGAVLGFIASASADSIGPALGAVKYTASIEAPAGKGPDTDTYAGSLVKGEKLSVTVTAAKGSALLPVIELIDPDGNVVTPPVKEKAGGKNVS